MNMEYLIFMKLNLKFFESSKQCMKCKLIYTQRFSITEIQKLYRTQMIAGAVT